MFDNFHCQAWGIGLLMVFGLTGCQTGLTTPTLSPQACEAEGDFVWIKPGEYTLGSDRKERDYAYHISAVASANEVSSIDQAERNLRDKYWFDGEPDQRVASLPSLCMGKNLITNAEYQAFVQATGHRSPFISASDYERQGFLVHPYSSVTPYLWKKKSFPPQEPQHPVVLVSYEDAQAFAQWRSEKDGQSYRLPTAVEWEQAARGTDGRYFPWGNDWQADATNWAYHGKLHTSAIATYPLSRGPEGVEDMAGNVFEYTSTLTQHFIQKKVIMKGCSWDDLPGFCRSAYQHARPLNARHILFGFRLVKE